MSLPKISLVTISYNQCQFLERAIQSVLGQNYPNLDYIVVDPGSTDGSREIIERYRNQIAHILYEPDRGPADGLNRGFSLATGEIYGYLNSDDELEPGALHYIAKLFQNAPAVDVFSGHATIVDSRGEPIRRVWSDPMNLLSLAYGASVTIQPSTFIRRGAFEKSGGFNIENKSSWDGELMLALAKTGAVITVTNKFLSKYRLHQLSITGSGSQHERMREWDRRRFNLIMGRDWTSYDRLVRLYWLLRRQFRNPVAFWERLTRGRVYRRAVTQSST